MPCGGERPPHGSTGAFAGGGASCFFPHGQEDLAAPLGFAVVRRERVGCPSNTGNKVQQTSPHYPENPVADRFLWDYVPNAKLLIEEYRARL